MGLTARALRSLLGVALDLLAPRLCAACDAPVSEVGLGSGFAFCSACSRSLVALSACSEYLAGAQIIAPYAYEPPLSTALHRFKYARRSDLAAPLGALLCDAVTASGLSCDLVVPVPLHPRRLAERGYNQAALLARELVGTIGGALAARALVRLCYTPGQVSQGRAQRLENVKGAFGVRPQAVLRGRRIALVDDVLTTGATALACMRALHTVGANVCAVITVARTLDSREARK